MKELRQHQRLALDKMSNGKVLWGGVGSGKTFAAAVYYLENEAPKNVYVITTARKRDDFDWQEQFYELGVGPASGPSAIPGARVPVHPRVNQPIVFPQATGLAARGSHTGDPVGTRFPHGSGDLDQGWSDRASLADPAGGEDAWYSAGEVRLGSTVAHLRRDSGDGQAESNDRAGMDHAGTTILQDERTQGEKRERSNDLRSALHDQRSAAGLDSGGAPATPGSRLLESDVSGYPTRGGAYPWVLTVDSWNNLHKYADVAGAFFIFDEQRVVGSGNWARKFLRIAKRNSWILLSATPGDTWMDYIPLFVANGHYKNRTAFLREHVVYSNFTKFPKVDRYIGQGKLARLRSELLVEMPVERHTRRQHISVELPFDKALLDRVLKDRWNVYEDRPLNDIAEMFLVGRRVVNSDPSRLEKVRELWQKHPRLIVFYNFNYELESLRSLTEPPGMGSTTGLVNGSSKPSLTALSPMNSGDSVWKSASMTASDQKRSLRTRSSVVEKSSTSSVSIPKIPTSLDGQIAEWNGHKHQPVPTSDRWLYLVQYTAGAEAWDCVTTDAMILHSQNYSWRTTQQAYGRIDRLNTPFKDLFYYGFMSNSFVDKAIERALKGKGNFNARKYKSIFEG